LRLVEHEAERPDELEVVGEQLLKGCDVAGQLGGRQAVEGLVNVGVPLNASFDSMAKA
jgi:hypothetical protein